jgi:L-cysteate sulfo-lyase
MSPRLTLSEFPRISLGQLNTPLDPLPRLSKFLGGPPIYMKRDDCTGLATGGNKTRKLEYLMADALKVGADSVIAVGAIQSNSVRQTAAAAAKLGLRCHLLLEDRVPNADSNYYSNGNIFLDRLLGATIEEVVPAGTDMQTHAEALLGTLKDKGGKPYLMPGGASNPIGALGYVRCAFELAEQMELLEVSEALILHATSSYGTQAGLAAGLALRKEIQTRLIGVTVRHASKAIKSDILALATETSLLVSEVSAVQLSDINVSEQYVGKAYGVPTDETLDAVKLVARLEGILLDPVYTGKAMGALIDMIRSKDVDRSENVIFVHTGGIPALFAYPAGDFANSRPPQEI